MFQDSRKLFSVGRSRMPRERKKGDRRPLLSPCSVTFGPVTLQYLFPHLEFALGVKGGLTQTGASARVRTHWRREQGEGAQRKQSRGNGLDSGELWDSGPSSDYVMWDSPFTGSLNLHLMFTNLSGVRGHTSANWCQLTALPSPGIEPGLGG